MLFSLDHHAIERQPPMRIAPGEKFGEVDSAPLDYPHQLFEPGKKLHDAQQLLAAKAARFLAGVGVANQQLCALQAQVSINLSHRSVVQNVLDLLLSRHLIERRLSAVDTP